MFHVFEKFSTGSHSFASLPPSIAWSSFVTPSHHTTWFQSRLWSGNYRLPAFSLLMHRSAPLADDFQFPYRSGISSFEKEKLIIYIFDNTHNSPLRTAPAGTPPQILRSIWKSTNLFEWFIISYISLSPRKLLDESMPFQDRTSTHRAMNDWPFKK